QVTPAGVVRGEVLAEQPPAVRAVLERCRAHDPSSRPTATQVASALRGETLPLTAAMWVRSTYSQRRWAAIAVVTVLAVLAGLIGGFATRGGSSSPTQQVKPVVQSSDATQQARN